AGCGQFQSEFLLSDLCEKGMRQGHEYACAIAGISFETTTPAVIHARIQMVSVQHDLVTGAALDVSDETDAAGVFLHARIIKAGFRWIAEFKGYTGSATHKSTGLICSSVHY